MFFFLLNIKTKLMILNQLYSGTNESCAMGWKAHKSFEFISSRKCNKLKVSSFYEIQARFTLQFTLFYCTYFCNYDKNLCNKNQLDTLFILSLFHQHPLRTSGIFVAHHQEVNYIYIQQLVRVVLFSWLSGQQTEVDWRKKLRIKSESSWFLLHKYIAMYRQQNIDISRCTSNKT